MGFLSVFTLLCFGWIPWYTFLRARPGEVITIDQNADFLCSIKQMMFVEDKEEAEKLIAQGWVYWNTISNQLSKSGHEIVLVKGKELGK